MGCLSLFRFTRILLKFEFYEMNFISFSRAPISLYKLQWSHGMCTGRREFYQAIWGSKPVALRPLRRVQLLTRPPPWNQHSADHCELITARDFGRSTEDVSCTLFKKKRQRSRPFLPIVSNSHWIILLFCHSSLRVKIYFCNIVFC